MTINLSKGERLNLSKENPNLKQAGIGLGWRVNKPEDNSHTKVDVYVFMLASNNKIVSTKYLLYSENLNSLDASTVYTGDSMIGNLGNDQKTVKVDLNKVDSSIQELVFVVTIYKAKQKKQSFARVDSSYIRIYNLETKVEIAKYEIKENFIKETGIEFGRLYRKDNQWRFQAVGAGYNAGLEVFADKYI